VFFPVEGSLFFVGFCCRILDKLGKSSYIVNPFYMAIPTPGFGAGIFSQVFFENMVHSSKSVFHELQTNPVP